MSTFIFSQRLQAAMDAANLNQAELARKVGVTRSAINQLLQGTSKGMKPENLVAVARALDVRVEWLATGTAHAHRTDHGARPRNSGLLEQDAERGAPGSAGYRAPAFG